MHHCITHIIKGVLLLMTILSPIFLWGQDKSTIRFIENKGQFNDQTDFQLKTNAGDIYLEGSTMTYCLYDKSLFTDIHHEKITIEDAVFEGHAYKVHFLNAQQTNIVKEQKSKEYYNYYIGSDKSKWASNIYGYGQVEYTNLYEGIDLKYYEYYGQLKYDLIVEPGGNTDDILIEYEGVENLKIKKGHLHIPTNLGYVIEQSPYAFQNIDGIEKPVQCNYKLDENKLSFDFPEGYDSSIELIIDPILTFATYTGSTADNWGYTATYDDDENMYIAGVAFAIGYPLSVGAFQTTYNGGNGVNYPGTDASISKFSADGTNLIYSTYYGGMGNENPHSIVCNAAGELYVFGSTSSLDLPTSAGTYDNSFNGGANVQNGVLNYVNGTDAYVAKFNASGTSLIGGTYIGGSGNDALNADLLRKNYGDEFRGEIIVDANDNCWVATTTSSIDFPVVNPFQATNGGINDAILFKFNSNLSGLLWSSYYGGTNADAAYSIQLNSLNQPIITGGTLSTDLTMSSGQNIASFGDTDGFIIKLNTTGSMLINSTYVGTAAYDQCYFVQVDLNDDVYVFGQSQGTYNITPSTVFSNPGSGQFIHKFDANLATTIFSTVFGSGSGINISPSAFLVSDCGLIYTSGWGGNTNAGYAGGNTTGMPLTGDAFQPTTDGSDFYLGVFNPDATSLVYGTFFGGGISAEHVDGGTSRFDKNGNVYQAVCAGCGGSSDFPTSAGAWSNTNNSSNCNLGAFKFDLGNITPAISIPQPWVCIPSSYQFDNLSSGGNVYEWDFGDGNFSNDFAPAHTYLTVGEYDVTLVVSDSLGCLSSDTVTIAIEVLAVDNAVIQQMDTICPGDSILLEASGGTSYFWTPTTYLSDPTISNPIAFPPATTTYQVIATDNCGIDTATSTIFVYISPTSTIPDVTICGGAITTLEAFGGINYSWYPSTAMINPSSQTPNVAPLTSITYYVDITTAEGCIITDSVVITAVSSVPQANISPDTTVCQGDLFEIYAYGASTILWSPANLVLSQTDSITTAQLTSDATIYVDLTNICGTITDSIQISVLSINPTIVNDTSICPGGYANLWAGGGDFYNWSPQESLSNPLDSATIASPSSNTTYSVEITNLAGCIKTLDVTVNIYPIPMVDAGEDVFIDFGDVISLNGTTYGNYFWDSQDSLSCIYCLSPEISPIETSSYILYTIDQNGCENSDTVMVFLDGALYIPNTFTPNSDGINDYFVTKGKEIKSFQLYIFNRWGQLIYTANNLDDYWDGRHKGVSVQNDTYVWKVTYEDYQNNIGSLIGHVNVLR
jgi:gliding motility-associated-like protein